MSELAANLLVLDTLSKAALKDRWATLTGLPVPKVSAGLLRLAIAWELQAREFGGPIFQTVVAEMAAEKGAANCLILALGVLSPHYQKWVGRAQNCVALRVVLGWFSASGD